MIHYKPLLIWAARLALQLVKQLFKKLKKKKSVDKQAQKMDRCTVLFWSPNFTALLVYPAFSYVLAILAVDERLLYRVTCFSCCTVTL